MIYGSSSLSLSTIRCCSASGGNGNRVPLNWVLLNLGIAVPAVKFFNISCPKGESIKYFINWAIVSLIHFTIMELGARLIGLSNCGMIKALPIEAPILLNINSPPYNFDFDKNSYPCLSMYVRFLVKLLEKSWVLTNIA